MAFKPLCKSCEHWHWSGQACPVEGEPERPEEVLVFGSNKKGVHGAGSALHARKHFGAILGRGSGAQGASYAIPTKDHNLGVMPLYEIKPYVDEFIRYARSHPKHVFNVVAIGCGLAGYSPEQIAPMFRDAPDNCRLPEAFVNVLTKHSPPAMKVR